MINEGKNIVTVETTLEQLIRGKGCEGVIRLLRDIVSDYKNNVVVIGKSDTGKSTMVKTLAGFISTVGRAINWSNDGIDLSVVESSEDVDVYAIGDVTQDRDLAIISDLANNNQILMGYRHESINDFPLRIGDILSAQTGCSSEEALESAIKMTTYVVKMGYSKEKARVVSRISYFMYTGGRGWGRRDLAYYNEESGKYEVDLDNVALCSLKEEVVATKNIINIKRDREVALMCPKCFNLIHCNQKVYLHAEVKGIEDDVDLLSRTVYRIDCPICKVRADQIELDVGIAEQVSHLNKKGYKTNYCCEGHGSGNTYISFETYKPTNVPEGWIVREYAPNVLERKTIGNEGKIEEIERLSDWVSNLKDISVQKDRWAQLQRGLQEV